MLSVRSQTARRSRRESRRKRLPCLIRAIPRLWENEVCGLDLLQRIGPWVATGRHRTHVVKGLALTITSFNSPLADPFRTRFSNRWASKESTTARRSLWLTLIGVFCWVRCCFRSGGVNVQRLLSARSVIHVLLIDPLSWSRGNATQACPHQGWWSSAASACTLHGSRG